MVPNNEQQDYLESVGYYDADALDPEWDDRDQWEWDNGPDPDKERDIREDR